MTEATHQMEDRLVDEPTGSDRLGRILKEARERRGLSREEVAQQLRLHERVIAALEEDNHGSLPPAAFVAGYIRSYGRLLELPSEELVGMYGRPEPRMPEHVGNVTKRGGVDSSALPVRLVTYTLLVGLVVLSGLWWVSNNPLEGFTLPGTEAPETELGTPEPLLPGGFGGMAPTVELPPGDPSTVPPPRVEAPAPVEPPPEEDAPAPEPPASANVAEEPVAEEPESVVEPEPADVEPIEEAVATAPAPATPPAAEPAAASGMPSLSLTFERDCWTEVKDAAGNRLIYDLVKGGRTRTVEGQAPFKVFLGYAPGVEVLYNGEPFDIEPFTERHIARFTVGEATDNPPAR